MKCQLCGSASEGTVLCPACLSKLSAASGQAGSFGRTPMPAPATPAAKPPAPHPIARQLWVYEEVKWPLAACPHPAGGAVILDQPEGYRLLHWAGADEQVRVLFQFEQGSETSQLDDPQGLCVSPEGHIAVADSGNDRIVFMEQDGNPRPSIGGLARPSDVRIDEDGFVYIADSFNGRVIKVSPDGLPCLELTEAGGWGRLSEPVALAIDRAQNIYVADRGRNLVVQFSAEGLPVRCWPPRNSGIVFEQIRDVEVGPDGSVWIGDHDNARVSRFAPSGGLTGVIDWSPETGAGVEGGTFVVVGESVIIPDRLNDRVVCLTFGVKR